MPHEDAAVPKPASGGRPHADVHFAPRQPKSSEPVTDRPSDASPAEEPHHHTGSGPDVGTADPTDGRGRYDWESHYPDAARAKIRIEAGYVVALLFLSLVLILTTWTGFTGNLLAVSGDAAVILKKYAIYTSSGLLGGAVFGIKYLYRVVARGYWHEDRRLWRYLSPLNSSALAFVMGAAVEASFVVARGPGSTEGVVVFGFLVGYFADQAISKLHEIATVVFGTASKSREPSDS